MAELFKLTIQKYAKLPGGAVALLVKTYEVSGSVLMLLAQDPNLRRDGRPLKREGDNFHRMTAGPLSTDASIEICAVEWTGKTGQSNAHASARPVDFSPGLPVGTPGAALREWARQHKEQGWQVPEEIL